MRGAGGDESAGHRLMKSVRTCESHNGANASHLETLSPPTTSCRTGFDSSIIDVGENDSHRKPCSAVQFVASSKEMQRGRRTQLVGNQKQIQSGVAQIWRAARSAPRIC